MDISSCFKQAIEQNASDPHLAAGMITTNKAMNKLADKGLIDQDLARDRKRHLEIQAFYC